VDTRGREIFHEEYLDPILTEPSGYLGYFRYGMTADENHIYVCSNRGVQILDMDGKVIKSRENEKEDVYVSISTNKQRKSEFKDFISIEKRDGSIELWNWEKGKTYASKGIDLRQKNLDEKHRNSRMSSNTYHPILLVARGNEDIVSLWNWEKNKVVNIPASQNYDVFIGKGELVHVISPGEKKGVIYSLQGKKIIEYTILGGLGDGFSPIDLTNDEEFILVDVSEEVKLYNKKGKLIKDFKEYDKDLTSAYFEGKENRVVTYTRNGLVAWWDMKGELIHETKIEAKDFWLERQGLSDSIIISHSFDIVKQWNLKGELLRDFGRASFNEKDYASNQNKNNKQSGLDLLSRSYWTGSSSFTSYVLANTVQPVVDSNIYQLTLIKEEKEYRTYVYLDAKTKLLIEKYNAEREKLRLKEKKRKGEEDKLLRTFAIQNFGIYNWDRFYKDNSEFLVRCKAEFNDEIMTGNSDISVFLISGENRNTVIKYDKSTFQLFNFNSSFYNKLIAILPDNKIAVFEDKDFKALDLKKIREEKQHKFEMKILGNVNAMDALKEMTEVAT